MGEEYLIYRCRRLYVNDLKQTNKGYTYYLKVFEIQVTGSDDAVTNGQANIGFESRYRL